MSSFVADKVAIKISYFDETLIQNVTFIADEDTATLVLIPTKNNTLYGNANGNQVEVTVVDANNNPLAGQVMFESLEPVTITPITASLDSSGKKKGQRGLVQFPLRLRFNC